LTICNLHQVLLRDETEAYEMVGKYRARMWIWETLMQFFLGTWREGATWGT